MAVTYRIATLSDTSQIADCGAISMIDDELFAALYPRRHADPARFRAYFKRRARNRLTDHMTVTLVAEMDDEAAKDGKSKRIVGFAQWQKIGQAAGETRWHPLKACENRLLAMQDWLAGLFGKSGELFGLESEAAISDPEAMKAFYETYDDLDKEYWIKDGVDHERWHLQLLGVLPEARRRGIGSKLVQLGIDRARRDGCDAGLEASPLGLSMYQRQGFEIMGTYVMERLLEEDGRPILSPVLIWRNPDIKHGHPKSNSKS
ncbi:hypothetical protein TWF696_005095 [Orbilia brochopaga]|uniref:N-acetyltransferase domain-containing protein n=1 Tax=Orbilia brochopaga TaxID=3140254 RepID=A0AAV9V2S3_9PEZI